ncbi:MAG TPA: SGNH/GDSL hydrolase family protein [Terriglobia bacterium]|nr:SGNH/GDSL hydrolase family protein [Terriglobia bacterium]
MKLRNLIVVVPVILSLVQIAEAQDRWIATWAAAPQVRLQAPLGGERGAPANQAPSGFNDQTVRMIVHAGLGGRRARVTLSNAFGNGPLTIGAAHLALRSKESAIVAGSDRALMFNGKPNITIAPGAHVISDAVDLDVPQLGDLAISVYVPGNSGQLTMHNTGLHTTYIAKGNVTGEPALNDATTTRSWYWTSVVEVMAPADTAAIVAFGDSITDGATSTNDANRSWPSILAQRILAIPGSPRLTVLNEGISGNRVLADGAGVNALARFDRDVFGHAGVKWLFIMEGINDIGQTTRANATVPPVTADELIAATKQMIERAHTHGIKVIGCTLTPYEGAAYYSEKGEEIRQAVNRWIRTGGAFDAVVDYDAVTRDSANPKTFKAGFNDGDHLHPNDAGYKAMADSVDLAIFSGKSAKRK